MARVFLIIDGYNLLHAAGLARARYGPRDLERCRQRLLTQLQSRLSAAAAAACTIVFDALEAPDQTDREYQHGQLQVVFAPAGSDADSEIERRLQAHSAPRQVLIVSSDHRLHRAARRRRARCVDSEEFWAGLEPAPGTPPAAAAPAAAPDRASDRRPDTRKPDMPLLSADLPDDFLQIDVTDIARDLQREDRRGPGPRQ